MAFHALADYQNHVIGWLQWEQSSLGDGAVVRFPRIWISSGECRLVQTSRIREGGHDYESFQSLINKKSTEQFKKAKNFFNAPSTPQKDITRTAN